MLTSDGSFGKILPGSLTSCGKATQWPFAASPPCFNICRFIHGEILDINCDDQFNKAVDCIRAFVLKEMNYNIYSCTICNETRIDMNIKNNICDRCTKDKLPFLLHLFLVCSSVSLSKGGSKVIPSFLHLECSSFSF
jgi:hypothetical protein